MILVLVLLIVSSVAWLAFTLGRVSADRRPNLNHHQMMVMLMEFRHLDDTVPIMDSKHRTKMNRLLDEYESLDFADV